jgi:hypothetical protein
MPVLIEALNVVVRRSSIDRRYPGGFPAFEANAPYLGPGVDTFCADDQLVRIGFTNSGDIRLFCEDLERLGFRPPTDMVDLVIVSVLTGPTVRCDWLELVSYQVQRGGVVQGARLRGSISEELVVPFGWTWASSLTMNCKYAPDSELVTAEYVGTTNSGVDVYRDEITGQPRYIGRSVAAPLPGAQA